MASGTIRFKNFGISLLLLGGILFFTARIDAQIPKSSMETSPDVGVPGRHQGDVFSPADMSLKGISFDFKDAPIGDIIKNVAINQNVNALIPTEFSSKVISLKVDNSTLNEAFSKVIEPAGIAMMKEGETFLFSKPNFLQNVPSAKVLKDLGSCDNISLDFRNVDIRDIVSFIAQRSKINIICMKHVRGLLSLKITDLPWSTVLRFVVGIMGYDCRLQGKTIYIAPKVDLDFFVPKLGPVNKSDPKISLTFRDADIRDIFKIIAHYFSTDFIAEKSVRGNATICLSDIGEEEAMKIVAHSNGFDCERVGKIWYLIDSRKKFEIKNGLKQPGTFPGSPNISLDFRDASIRDILQIASKKANLELSMPDSIGGNITLRINDLPAMEVIQNLAIINGFDVTLKGSKVVISEKESSNPDSTVHFENSSSPIQQSSQTSPETTPQYGGEPVASQKKMEPLPPPPLKIVLMGIVGDDKNRRATIDYLNKVLVVGKGDWVEDVFQVVEVLPDEVVVYSKAEQLQRAFFLNGEARNSNLNNYTPPPNPPMLKIVVMGIVGDDKNRRATIEYLNQIMVVGKGDCVEGAFQVVDILPDKIVVYSKAEQLQQTFPIGGGAK
ncbi:MAG: hypothetical protein HQM08_05995 [Candidatus Riflebacteria bacterium]|nr:hypothetical protein [Candidatus Riflebacteria bacterium]